ncbi:Na/Pi cotransporter family protein [Dysosmobacter sp. HCP28S3_G4]|uniref:Na/Pi cotransporter family protein n=1 Tax=Dysosmobacter sp. HCP28S3_G4 TaxID=3438938 RepID=UPI003F0D328A|nr:Na/Pi cotransporter family protein [Dysosmobacter sp.]
MDIFSVLTLCGGLAFFLYGMHTMSKSLEKMAGGKLERLLKQMTSNPFKSLLLGAGITIAIQSSSAVTVMLVGLVNSGVMELGQTIGVIMGSNIGTTLTAWILSLTGLESENVWINLLKPENFSPAIALIGVILIMGGKKQKQRDVGRIMVGFSILMYGMELMKNAVAPLADMPEFSSILTAFENPLVGVLVGAVFTGVIQSSAASVGILQALALTGSISYGMAIPIIMGQNIGTCVTALISSIGVNRNAKQVAVVHISFNVIGTAICLILFYGAHAILQFTFIDNPINAVGIAFCHTVFNVFTTIILLPFSRQLEKLARTLVKSEDKSQDFAFLDPLLLRTPSVAISECVSKTNQMAEVAHQNLLLSIEQFREYSSSREAAINDNEDKLDTYEDRLGNYLVEISRHNISMADGRDAARLLHAINDFERIGDHALNLQETAQELHDKGLAFSDDARAELNVLVSALTDILDQAFSCFTQNDAQAAAHVEPLEETIDRLIEEIRLRHIERLQSGRCTIQLGFILNDFLTNCERVSDHCSNIALCVIESKGSNISAHAYVNEIKAESTGFSQDLRADLNRYTLPNP